MVPEEPTPFGAGQPARRTRLKLYCLIVLVAALAADLATKAWMEDLLGMSPAEVGSSRRIEVIDGFFALEGSYNPGVTFGLAGHKTEEIVILTLLATVGLILWFSLTRSQSKLLHVGLALILSGALGNLWDRWHWQKVRDFILWYVRIDGEEHKWPNFNVADSCIVVGVILIIWDSLFGLGAEEARAKAEHRKRQKLRKKARAS